MSASIASNRMPSAIEAKLRSVRTRACAVAAVRSLASGWIVLTVLMAAAMIIDWAFPFMPTAVRTLLTGGTICAAIASIFLIGFRPIRNALGWNGAAATVDEMIPQLEERWSTVTSLASRDRNAESTVAKAMADQVTSEAVAMGRVVHPPQVISSASLGPILLAAAA